MGTDMAHPSLAGTTVLIVEDEFYLAVEMRNEIEDFAGTVIGPFANPEDAIASLAEGTPDCALIDINLGEGPSFIMADALLAREVPFAFLTGYDAGSIPMRFRDVTRIEKPTTRIRIIEALMRLRGNPLQSGDFGNR